MRRLKGTGIVAAVVILLASACSANETLNRQTVASMNQRHPLLVAGIEEAASGTRLEASALLRFYLRNTSETDIDFLTWNTPFEQELSADVFQVRLAGEPVAYTGRMVKRGAPQPENYLRVPAGQQIETLVDLSDWYDMERPGRYLVIFDPVVIDGVARLNQDTPVTVESKPVVIVITRP